MASRPPRGERRHPRQTQRSSRCVNLCRARRTRATEGQSLTGPERDRRLRPRELLAEAARSAGDREALRLGVRRPGQLTPRARMLPFDTVWGTPQADRRDRTSASMAEAVAFFDSLDPHDRGQASSAASSAVSTTSARVRLAREAGLCRSVRNPDVDPGLSVGRHLGLRPRRRQAIVLQGWRTPERGWHQDGFEGVE
jgi:hypothetical protein